MSIINQKQIEDFAYVVKEDISHERMSMVNDKNFYKTLNKYVSENMSDVVRGYISEELLLDYLVELVDQMVNKNKQGGGHEKAVAKEASSYILMEYDIDKNESRDIEKLFILVLNNYLSSGRAIIGNYIEDLDSLYENTGINIRSTIGGSSRATDEDYRI